MANDQTSTTLPDGFLTITIEELRAALDWAVDAGLLARSNELYGLPGWFEDRQFVAPKALANRLAQRRFVERLKAEPDKWEAHKRKERRRQRINYAHNTTYAERKRALQNAKYASDPEVRARAAARNAKPEEKQRRRVRSCISKGSVKHLPDQLKILEARASRLLREIAET